MFTLVLFEFSQNLIFPQKISTCSAHSTIDRLTGAQTSAGCLLYSFTRQNCIFSPEFLFAVLYNPIVAPFYTNTTAAATGKNWCVSEIACLRKEFQNNMFCQTKQWEFMKQKWDFWLNFVFSLNTGKVCLLFVVGQ